MDGTKTQNILNLINQEIDETAPNTNTQCENEVRVLNMKYSIKRIIETIIRLENEECTCNNTSTTE